MPPAGRGVAAAVQRGTLLFPFSKGMFKIYKYGILNAIVNENRYNEFREEYNPLLIPI
ncbi:MAG: hypothetical protein LBQ54_05820 [Planctomycetaceae bacterium]|jgi:hypothetical protein|nr:hypothetical protein [Planctomycetaceae bacterium]